MTQQIQTDLQRAVSDLYQAVDNKDVSYLEQHLSEQIEFAIGNQTPLTDKQEILAANTGFFASIESMKHRLDSIVISSAEDSNMNSYCHGQVNYVRLDGSAHSAVFATFLTFALQADGEYKITDYKVFADLSGL